MLCSTLRRTESFFQALLRRCLPLLASPLQRTESFFRTLLLCLLHSSADGKFFPSFATPLSASVGVPSSADGKFFPNLATLSSHVGIHSSAPGKFFPKRCHFCPHLATPLSVKIEAKLLPNTPKLHHLGHVVRNTWTTGGPRLDHGSIPMRNWDRGPIPGDLLYYYIKDREPDHEPKNSRSLQGGGG